MRSAFGAGCAGSEGAAASAPAPAGGVRATRVESVIGILAFRRGAGEGSSPRRRATTPNYHGGIRRQVTRRRPLSTGTSAGRPDAAGAGLVTYTDGSKPNPSRSGARAGAMETFIHRRYHRRPWTCRRHGSARTPEPRSTRRRSSRSSRNLCSTRTLTH